MVSELHHILLADTDQFTQIAIQEITEKSNNLNLVASIISEEYLVESIRLYCPEVLLLSYKMLKQVQEKTSVEQVFLHTKTVLLLADANEVAVTPLIKMGVLGCVLKSDPPNHLLEAIYAAIHNQNWFSQKLLIQLVAADLQKKDISLTEREQDILHFLVSGKTDMEIAQALHISKRTVRRDLEEIYNKLNVTSRAQAAYEIGIRNLLKGNDLKHMTIMCQIMTRLRQKIDRF